MIVIEYINPVDGDNKYIVIFDHQVYYAVEGFYFKGTVVWSLS